VTTTELEPVEEPTSASEGADAVEEVLAKLDREMVGLGPVKERIREMAALLVIDQLRREARGRKRNRLE